MAWFEAFRNEYGFAYYKDNRTPVTYDIPLLKVTYMCVLVSIATLIATLGIRGRERWSFTIRAMYAVGIGSIILACLVGYGWQEGSVKITSHYIYRNNLPFEGYVGVKVALDAVNVTLDGNYRGVSGTGYVYYAESMPWSDFGHESESYSYFLEKGLPEPILKVMEFLTVDEGGMRWGRTFHSSGHYAMALLWTSFAFWIVSNVLLCSVVVYGAYMFTLTGVTMILACVTYHVCQCPLPLVICFGEETLRITYSWSFWLTVAAGCCTTVIGILLIVMDHVTPARVSEFFHLEKLVDDDSFEQADYRQESYKNPVVDRRGSMVPPSNDRRGSIFLDPSRQPGLLKEKLKLSFLPASNIFSGKSSRVNGQHSKVNPLYADDGLMKGSSFDGHEFDVRVQMERVCEDCDVCFSTKKPSLATLKEHRDNHANEKLSTSSDKPTSRYIRQGQHNRRLSSHDSVFTIGTPDKLHSTYLSGGRRGSCPANTYTGHLSQRSISETSEESQTGETFAKSASTEVLVSVEPERVSEGGSPSTQSSSLESNHGESKEELKDCESESSSQSRTNSESSCDSELSEVVVSVDH